MAIKINTALYAAPTNKAIYEAMMCLDEKPFEQQTKRLLSMLGSAKLSEEFLQQWLQTDDLSRAIMTLKEMQGLGLIRGVKSLAVLPDSGSEAAINACLAELQADACMLANDMGFNLAHVGFAAESIDELAAVAAELHAFHLKRVKKLTDNSLVNADVWSLLSPQSHSRMTFWPLHTDHHNFILIIRGKASFNNNGLMHLARILMNKYNH